MAKILELAKMAEAAYDKNLHRGSMVSSWTCIHIRRSSGSLNGFQGAIFSKQGATVVAFRGTAQAMDLVADIKLGTGMNSTYFYLGEQYTSLVSGGNIIVTGHSLGGAIAQVVANRTGHAMATFNAPGVAVIASRNMHKSNPLLNIVRFQGMLSSAVRHPFQAASDVKNAFRSVRGLNLCLKNDVVSKIGNHY